MHFWTKFTTKTPLCEKCRSLDLCTLLLNPRDSMEYHYRSVLPTDKDGCKHHHKFKYLRRTAAQGCELCKLIEKHWGYKPDMTAFGRTWNNDEDMVLIAAIGGWKGWDGKKRSRPYISVFSQPWFEACPGSSAEPGRKRVECSFEILAETYELKKGREKLEGRDHLEDILGKSYGSDPQVQTSLVLADAWLKRCNKNHAECSQAKTRTPAPTRLIQVGSISEHPKLSLTHPQDCEWVALSYCWGGHSNFTLTTARLKAFQRCMPYKKCPKTIRDAILVTRSLGIKYLWVDAICIIQDSTEDWGFESTKMCDVYKGAVITISASSSLKAAEGFLHQRKLQTNNCILPWKTPDPDDSQSAEDQRIVTKGTSLGFPPPRKFMPNTVSLRFFDEEEQRHIGIEKGPLSTRGWVLQEELFSGRRLTFRGDQMVWECSTFQFCEGGFARHYLPNRYYDGNLWSEFKLLSTSSNPDSHLETKHIHKVLDTWYDTLEQYSTRQLTRSTDRLPAISSLAKEFGRLKGDDTYCAGLWRSDMIKGLLWTPVYTKQIKWDMLGIPPKERSPKKPYTGPSWSWASLDPWPLEIKYVKGCPPQPKNESESKYSAKVLDVTTQTSSSNLFGSVTNGSITLEAPFCYIAGRQEEDDSGGKTSAVEKWIARSFKTEYTKGEWLHEYLVQHEGYPGQHFAAAILLDQGSFRYFLFLESVQPASQSEIQQYRRIGLVVQLYDEEDGEMAKHNWGLPRKEVTIV